jgi:molecular chaperone GrpE
MAGPVGDELITGIVLIYKQLTELLERHDVLPIEAQGAIFDPNLHEAVIIEPRPGYEANTVVAEIEKGYTIGTRLLRPARVKVAIRNQ